MRRRLGRATALVTLMCGAAAPQFGHGATPSEEALLPPKATLEASIQRGQIVYSNYCQLCHGTKGDGNGRTARLYSPRPANLVTATSNADYVELIVRKGGEAIGRSPFMPPWNDELTDEQVRDVVNFVGSISQNGAAGR